MGFLRKSLFVATGGLSGAAGIKANSKKERTAKAQEAQLRLMRQQARQTQVVASPKPLSAQQQRLTDSIIHLKDVTYVGGNVGAFTTTEPGTLVRQTLHVTARGGISLRPNKRRESLWIGPSSDRIDVRAGAHGIHIDVHTAKGETAAFLYQGPDTLGRLEEQFAPIKATQAKERAERQAVTARSVAAQEAAERAKLAKEQEHIALVADGLLKLASLRDKGILSEEEFAAQKAKLMADGPMG